MAGKTNNKRRAVSETSPTDQGEQLPEKRKRGRPQYAGYTPSNRRVVEVMAAHNIRHEEIANAIEPPCDSDTLRKHFGKELAIGGPRLKYQIANAVDIHLKGRPATYDDNGNCLTEEVKPSHAVAIFMSKVKLGYRENAPEMPVLDLTRLSDDELAIFERLMAKVAPPEVGALMAPDVSDPSREATT